MTPGFGHPSEPSIQVTGLTLTSVTAAGSTPATVAASATIIAIVLSGRVSPGRSVDVGNDGTPVEAGADAGPVEGAADGPPLLAQPASVITASTALAIGRDGMLRRGRLDAGENDIGRMLRRDREVRRRRGPTGA
jgi:hypothetical protein